MMARANDEQLISAADKIYIAMRWRDFTEKSYLESIKNNSAKSDGPIYVFGRKDLSISSISIATTFGRTVGIERYATKFTQNDARTLNNRISKIANINFVDLLKITCPTGFN